MSDNTINVVQVQPTTMVKTVTKVDTSKYPLSKEVYGKWAQLTMPNSALLLCYMHKKVLVLDFIKKQTSFFIPNLGSCQLAIHPLGDVEEEHSTLNIHTLSADRLNQYIPNFLLL